MKTRTRSEPEFLKLIIAWNEEAMTTRDMAIELNARGLKTPRGEAFTSQNVLGHLTWRGIGIKNGSNYIPVTERPVTPEKLTWDFSTENLDVRD